MLFFESEFWGKADPKLASIFKESEGSFDLS